MAFLSPKVMWRRFRPYLSRAPWYHRPPSTGTTGLLVHVSIALFRETRVLMEDLQQST
ncbi:MAG: hypothetical protein JRN11_05565 [Nitrososphaerota archaeon]|nr:hypothetical protein [Nitrososphaerota archaeon]MDG7013118.1 hypothetical protein [Nitrososphaerota archaeon]MDG7026199.1 hypothetical protein [Nitrososphaerota archaeon]